MVTEVVHTDDMTPEALETVAYDTVDGRDLEPEPGFYVRLLGLDRRVGAWSGPFDSAEEALCWSWVAWGCPRCGEDYDIAASFEAGRCECGQCGLVERVTT